MNLSTQYLGLILKHPLMPGASPMVDDLDLVRRLEDAGAAAIVMHSLFEEQITLEDNAYHFHVGRHRDAFAESLDFLPERDDFTLSPDRYLEQVRRIKAAVEVPVIASLNGSTPGGWTRYARHLESAGAVQMVSALLQHGPERLGTVLEDMTRWLDEHEYSSLDPLRGSMSLRHCPDPAAYERTNYLRVLQGWRV